MHTKNTQKYPIHLLKNRNINAKSSTFTVLNYREKNRKPEKPVHTIRKALTNNQI